jgi:hypothetical protein
MSSQVKMGTVPIFSFSGIGRGIAIVMMAGVLLCGCQRGAGERVGALEEHEVVEEAYVYAFPMIAAYKALYEFNVAKDSGQYKGPFNEIANDAHVFTPADTAVVTPNSDTPYSMLQMDLRAEPIVVCVPEVEAGRYYSVQLTDLYAFNYGYIGSRATGNGAGCYLIAGPGWSGAAPSGIAKVFRSETQFSLAIFRTQLLGPDDIDDVKAVQAGYKAAPLSSFVGQPAPPQPPKIEFPPFSELAFKTDFISYLNFLLQFCPPVAEEESLRARFAEVGIAAGEPFNLMNLAEPRRVALELGVKAGFDRIKKRQHSLGKNVNNWRIGSSFGDREFYHGDYELRAAAALAGIYGNDAEEALYPMTTVDSAGRTLDGAKFRYTLTFPAGQLPPVKAFWSVTMYDAKTQLLVDNPIHRYLINSPMLPQMRKNDDGSLTLYIQKDSPGTERESNWLPAPAGPIYLVMRLYRPEPPALDGSWQPPSIMRAAALNHDGN